MADEPVAPGTEVPAVEGACAAPPRRARRAPATKAKAKPKAKRKPATRWTAARANLFLAALAETANIAGSARHAKVCESTVRRRREADADFAARWNAALRAGYLKLEADMLARALAGVKRPQYYGGKQVGEIHEYDDRLALLLLNRHRAAVMGPAEAGPAPPVPIEEARERFRARLADMNRRMGGSG